MQFAEGDEFRANRLLKRWVPIHAHAVNHCRWPAYVNGRITSLTPPKTMKQKKKEQRKQSCINKKKKIPFVIIFLHRCFRCS